MTSRPVCTSHASACCGRTCARRRRRLPACGECCASVRLFNARAAAVDGFAAHVRLLRNTANVGFARGVNQGLAASKAPYVLVMNPDCRLMAGAITTLRTALDAHDQCAIVGPRVLNPDGSVQGSARGDPDMLTGL